MLLEVFNLVWNGALAVLIVRHLLFSAVALKCKVKPKEVNPYIQPKVTIIIPAKDEEAVIERLLYSLTELTYPKGLLQVIVVNDGSTDRTAQIVEEYNQRYYWIQVIHHNKNHGKADSLNEALEFSNGEYIVFFDADYLPEPGFIEKCLADFTSAKFYILLTRQRLDANTRS